MKLILAGVNHKTAPIAVRERIAIPAAGLAEATRALAALPGVEEAMILSTCNRIELVAVVEPGGADLAARLYEYFRMEPDALAPHLYLYRDAEAVRHLFRVAASLDSMVLGEPQILGQVKEAYALAREAGTVSTHLDRLLQAAFAAAKKVRTETGIAASSVSVASVAVDLARKIFGTLQGKKVLLVGAGKMSDLAARHLLEQGVGTILIANRTHERALRMAAQFEGRVLAWEQLPVLAHEADIVITSTGSPHPIFGPEHAHAFLHRRRNRPMFFIDIAVPRDVDPAVNRIEGIFLYDIDDLQSVAASHLEARGREAAEAEHLVAAEVERFERGLRRRSAAPAIARMQSAAERLRQAELERVRARLESLSAEQMAAVEALSRGLVNKFLHAPICALKQAASDGDEPLLAALGEIYAGDAADSAPAPEAAENGAAASDRLRRPEVAPEAGPEGKSAPQAAELGRAANAEPVPRRIALVPKP